MRMRIALAVVAAMTAAVVAGAFAGSSKADTPTTVSLVGCIFLHGGQVTVPAGSTISFRITEGARTAGLNEDFLRALDLNVSVDGASVADPMSYWSDPTAGTVNGTDGSLTTWLYPTGITLQSGDSLTNVWNGVLTRPVPDGFGPVTPAGDWLGGNDTCTVTAS
jgi:hypothetical protein